MRAATLGPDAAFAVEDLPDPVPGPDDLVLRADRVPASAGRTSRPGR